MREKGDISPGPQEQPHRTRGHLWHDLPPSHPAHPSKDMDTEAAEGTGVTRVAEGVGNGLACRPAQARLRPPAPTVLTGLHTLPRASPAPYTMALCFPKVRVQSLHLNNGPNALWIVLLQKTIRSSSKSLENTFVTKKAQFGRE